MLIAELDRVLGYPKIERLIPTAEARGLVAWIEAEASVAEDPTGSPAIRSEDPGDDYLIALAAGERAALVSGDKHLQALSDRMPIFTPAEFYALLEERGTIPAS